MGLEAGHPPYGAAGQNLPHWLQLYTAWGSGPQAWPSGHPMAGVTTAPPASAPSCPTSPASPKTSSLAPDPNAQLHAHPAPSSGWHLVPGKPASEPDPSVGLVPGPSTITKVSDLSPKIPNSLFPAQPRGSSHPQLQESTRSPPLWRVSPGTAPGLTVWRWLRLRAEVRRV